MMTMCWTPNRWLNCRLKSHSLIFCFCENHLDSHQFNSMFGFAFASPCTPSCKIFSEKNCERWKKITLCKSSNFFSWKTVKFNQHSTNMGAYKFAFINAFIRPFTFYGDANAAEKSSALFKGQSADTISIHSCLIFATKCVPKYLDGPLWMKLLRSLIFPFC